MKQKLFTGVGTALITPFHQDGSIDFEALNKAIDTLNQVIEPLAKFFKVFG